MPLTQTIMAHYCLQTVVTPYSLVLFLVGCVGACVHHLWRDSQHTFKLTHSTIPNEAFPGNFLAQCFVMLLIDMFN